MEIGSVRQRSNAVSDEAVNPGFFQEKLTEVNSWESTVFDDQIEENWEDFFRYLERLGISSDSNMLVLPSSHHYFYDAEDLKEVKTVINLKQLNHIKQIKNFLHTISQLLPQKSHFVGCFVDNRSQSAFSDKYSNKPVQFSGKADVYENGIESRIPFINRMYNFFDSKTNRYLTRRAVVQLLEEYGLKIIGMTELNGLTYFCTLKTHPTAA